MRALLALSSRPVTAASVAVALVSGDASVPVALGGELEEKGVGVSFETPLQAGRDSRSSSHLSRKKRREGGTGESERGHM